jgi:hypothetical protein
VQLIFVDPMLLVSGRIMKPVYIHHALIGAVQVRAYSGTAGAVTMAQLAPRAVGESWQWIAFCRRNKVRVRVVMRGGVFWWALRFNGVLDRLAVKLGWKL